MGEDKFLICVYNFTIFSYQSTVIWSITRAKPSFVIVNQQIFPRLVCCGGDGTVSLVFRAYYKRYARDSKLDIDDPATDLLKAPLPIGILPTGWFMVYFVT